jgi:hypothetical protein
MFSNTFPSPSPATNGTGPIEEATLPDYDQNNFHHTTPGSLLSNRYTIVSKLGFGRHSTVWMAEDNHAQSIE